MNPTTIHIGGRKKLCPDDIILLEGDANYTVFYLQNGKEYKQTLRRTKVNVLLFDFLESDSYLFLIKNKLIM